MTAAQALIQRLQTAQKLPTKTVLAPDYGKLAERLKDGKSVIFEVDYDTMKAFNNWCRRQNPRLNLSYRAVTEGFYELTLKEGVARPYNRRLKILAV